MLVGMQTGIATLENSMGFLKKLKIELPYPSNCNSRYLPKGYKNTDSKWHMHPSVDGNIVKSSQTMERAQMSIN